MKSNNFCEIDKNKLFVIILINLMKFSLLIIFILVICNSYCKVTQYDDDMVMGTAVNDP